MDPLNVSWVPRWDNYSSHCVNGAHKRIDRGIGEKLAPPSNRLQYNGSREMGDGGVVFEVPRIYEIVGIDLLAVCYVLGYG